MEKMGKLFPGGAALGLKESWLLCYSYVLFVATVPRRWAPRGIRGWDHRVYGSPCQIAQQKSENRRSQKREAGTLVCFCLGRLEG